MSSNNNKKQRVVVVGLDGATLDIMRPMFKEGRLKNFHELADRGFSGILTSTILPLSATAWNSLSTGKNPAKHGIYDFSKRVKGTYTHSPTTSLDRGSRTLWDYASAVRRKCLIVNVPLTYPPEKVNGIMVSGFPYPEARRDYAEPRSVLDEIKENLGITRLHKPSPHFLKPGDERKLVDEMFEINKNQALVCNYLLQKYSDWELFVTVFDATDVISHFFWCYIDPNNPKYDKKKAEEFAPLFYDVYESVDRAFGEIRKNFTEDDNIFIMSDHGFGPVYYAVYMNNWLMENGYLSLKSSAGTRMRKLLFKMGVTTDFLFRSAKKLHLVGSKTYTYSKKSRSLELAKKFSLSLEDIDWEKTRVYSYGNYGQFFLNVKGREPLGKIERGEEYDRVVSELISKVKELKDPKSGRILFDIVYKKSEIYSGPYFESAPDIIFFDSTMTYRAHRLFEFGSKNMIAPDPIYSGSHRMEGMLISAGGDIANLKQEQAGISLIDLAPTIMHMLDVPIPQDVDGRVLSEVFKDESKLKAQKVLYENPQASQMRAIAQNLLKGNKKRI